MIIELIHTRQEYALLLALHAVSLALCRILSSSVSNAHFLALCAPSPNVLFAVKSVLRFERKAWPQGHSDFLTFTRLSQCGHFLVRGMTVTELQK